MLTVHTLSFYVHVAVGSIALVVFWLPVFARKGSPFHKRAGRWFAYSMYAVSVTAFIMSIIVLIDPIGIRHPERDLAMADAFAQSGQTRVGAAFLLMLGVLVFTSVRHSILVLRVKGDRSALRRPSHLGMLIALAALGLIVGYYGTTGAEPLLMIFAAISVVAAVGMLRYSFKRTLTRNEWWIEHMSNIIGGGIGAYTAFFAFGGRRFLADVLTGQWQILPWILPSVIGVGFITYLSRRYRARFGAMKEQTA